jgi:hypothetical protein
MIATVGEGSTMRDAQCNETGTASLRYGCVAALDGYVLVVMSEVGVVDLIAGDERNDLLSEAARRLPGMVLVPDDGTRADWVAGVIRRLELPNPRGDFPVDLAFGQQARVA